MCIYIYLYVYIHVLRPVSQAAQSLPSSKLRVSTLAMFDLSLEGVGNDFSLTLDLVKITPWKFNIAPEK